MICGNAITTTGTLYIAIDQVKGHRLTLATPTSLLEIAVNNLDSTAVNSYASRGRILGADDATETTELIRTQFI
jgi:flagellin-like hook-associated protein FlgL